MFHRNETAPAYWEERQMVEQVHALRHLPPGTWLPKPDHQPDRHLLAGLLSLEDGIDSLKWLEESHGKLTAQVVFWTALHHIRSLVKGMRLADLAGFRASDDHYRQLLAKLLDLPEDVELFRKLAKTHPTTGSPDLLRSVYQEIRILRGDTSPLPPIREGGDDLIPIESLWVDLFQLAEAIDPLEWIQHNRGHLAAIATLYHILNQVCSPHPMLLGSENKIEHPVRVYRPNTRLRAEGLSLVLRELVLGKTSFTLSLQTRIPERMLPVPFIPGTRINWKSISRVVDNLGNHYVVWHHLHEGGTHWRAYKLALLLVCYPAIAPDATEITLSTDHMAVVVIGRRDLELPLQTFHQLFLGDLTWRVKLVRRVKNPLKR